MIYAAAIISVVLGVAFDQYTKYLAGLHLQGTPITLIDGVFQLRYLENRGAAFGLLQNQQVFFVVISLITLLVIGVLYVRLPKEKHFVPLRICLILVVAGAIGNMIDRLRLNYVVDFFYFELIDFPVFNVADIYASVATFGLIILLLFYYSDKDFDLILKSFSLRKREKQE